MSRIPGSGRITALGLALALVLTIPAIPVLAHGLTAPTSPPAATDTSLTPMVPMVNLTVTPTATSTPTDSEDPPQGTATTAVVDDDAVAGGGATGAECPDARYNSIQAAVDDASRGNTIVVCAGQYESVEIGTGNLTLRAHGEAVIESIGRPAVRTDAPRVTIAGFTLRATGTNYTVAVGSRRAVIRNNIVEVTTPNRTGIFLSDGREPKSGADDPDLDVARGSRVVSNVIDVTHEATPGELTSGIFTDADRTVIRANTIHPNDNTRSIRSAGNETVIRGNEIRNPEPCSTRAFGSRGCSATDKPPAILIGNAEWTMIRCCTHGKSAEDSPEHASHNWARRNRIVNNTIANHPGEAIHIVATGNHSEIPAVTRGIIVTNNRVRQSGGILGWSNGAVVSANSLDVDSKYSAESPESPEGAYGIAIHGSNTSITGNHVEGYGIAAEFRGQNLTIRNNTFVNSGQGVRLWRHARGHSSRAEVRRRETSMRFIDNEVSGIKVLEAVNIKGTVTRFAHNRITGNADHGVRVAGNVSEFVHNRIASNADGGLDIGGHSDLCVSLGATCAVTVGALHHNNITNNGRSGVTVTRNATVQAFHHNLIDNNGGVGIHKQNYDKTDGEWAILNATDNIWGCGGPAGGLEDPVTGRVANGTGDELSASDESGVSNVNFDPFYVRQDEPCPSAMSNPTPQPSATPTLSHTPTPSPTPSATPSPTAVPMAPPGSGNGTGPGSGNGTGGTGGSGGGGSSGGDTEGATGDPITSTTPNTPTATPSETPTQTVPPTPVVEPGFGIVIGLGAVLLLGALVASRRRITTAWGNGCD